MVYLDCKTLLDFLVSTLSLYETYHSRYRAYLLSCINTLTQPSFTFVTRTLANTPAR